MRGTNGRTRPCGRRALAEPDSWEALRHYITAAAALQARDRAIADLVTLDVSSAPEIERLRVHAVRGVETLIERAKAAGTLRADCTAEDVLILLQSNAGLIERSKGAAASASQRLMHLLLDGLRAGRGNRRSPAAVTTPHARRHARAQS